MNETTSIQLSNVYEGGKTYLFENLPLSMLITEFKLLVCDRLEEKPLPINQRLIHRGKICDDSSTLGQILSHGASPPHLFHLVLSGRTSIKRAMSEPVKAPSTNTPKPTVAPAASIPTSPPVSEPSSNQSTPSSVSRAQARAAAAEAAEARKKLFTESSSTDSTSNETTETKQTTKNDSRNHDAQPSNGSERGGGSEGGGGDDGDGDATETLKTFEESYVKAASSSPAALAAHEAWCNQVHQWKHDEAIATRASQIMYQRLISESWAARSYAERGYATSVEEAYAAHAGMSSHWMNTSHSQPTRTFSPPQVREVSAVVTIDQLLNAYRAHAQHAHQPQQTQPPQEQQQNVAGAQDAGAGQPVADALPGVPNGAVRRLHFVFFFGADDLKLALKLIVMVGLFGQNGDQFRLISLSCFALIIFIYQVYANNQARRRQLAGGVDNPVPADANANAPGGAGGAPLQGDDDEPLPPVEMRGLLQGGIAPGGGFIVDIGYLLVSFVASMVPSWQPLPVCDPVIMERRRVIEARRAMRASQRDAAQGNDGVEEEDEFAELPPLGNPDNGHLHQD